MKADDYADIGLYLRDCRESLRITLARAAGDLHIRIKYLQALESGTVSELPGKAYINGYIRNYAEYLQLDASEVLKAYEALLISTKPEFFIPEPTHKQNLPSLPILRLTIIALLGVYFYWYFFIHDHQALLNATPELPLALSQMLDKQAGFSADTFACLRSGQIDCYLTLRSRVIPETLYDLNTPTQKP